MTPPVTARPPAVRRATAHSLDSVIGHDLIRQYLRGAMALQALPHALLFHGPRGVGKGSMAFGLAKTLNCREGGPAGCSCNTCRKISEEIFADIVLVEPRGAAGQITLVGWKSGNDPDGLQYYRFVDSRPMEGGRKVMIIRQADRMNVAVANHLLKLIEEPPTYLTIILLTHRPGDLPTTVRSRCAPLKFSPLDAAQMRRFLEQWSPAAAADTGAAKLIRLAEGRPGLLADLLAGGATERRKMTAEAMKRFQGQGFLSLFAVASDLVRAGSGTGGAEQFESVLDMLQAWMRDTLLVKVLPEATARELVLDGDFIPLLRAYGEQADDAALLSAFEELSDVRSYVPRQTDRAYVLETVLMRIGRAMRR